MNLADYKETLKCIKEVVDAFRSGVQYTPKQYQEELNRIDKLLTGAGI